MLASRAYPPELIAGLQQEMGNGWTRVVRLEQGMRHSTMWTSDPCRLAYSTAAEVPDEVADFGVLASEPHSSPRLIGPRLIAEQRSGPDGREVDARGGGECRVSRTPVG
jgi:hypothetical protein